MAAKLIMTDPPIIINYQKVKPGDKFFWYENHTNYGVETLIELHGDDGEIYECVNGGILNVNVIGKVIGESFQIDWNELESEFGYVDVRKLAIEEHKFNDENIEEISFRLGFEIGFQRAQKLNDKKFTLNDLRDAYREGATVSVDTSRHFEDLFRSFDQLQTFNIEIEVTRDRVKILKKL
jgi:hypothetical protein